jgi:hypothetical protein
VIFSIAQAYQKPSLLRSANMSENQKRVTLLSAAEIEDIYELPEFNEYERSLYFNFDDKDRKVIKVSKDQNAKIQLMLKIGYFKAKQRLFTFDACQTSSDIQYLQNLYFNNTIIDLTKLDPRTEKSQKQIILSHFGYESYEDVAESVKAKLSVLIVRDLSIRVLPNHFISC